MAKPDIPAHIFSVDTRFQRLARRPGGVPRAQALEKAQTAIEQSAPEFEAWVERGLTELLGLIDGIRAGDAPPDWREAVSSHARQLGDAGTTMGYALLTFVADSLCAIMESAQAGDPTVMESIACHIDALLLARQKEYRNLRPEELPELSKGLRLVAETVSIDPSQPPQ